MRQIKKIAALALALVLTFAMSVTAFAANKNGYTITIDNDAEGHVYEAYQILAGDLSEDESTLSNVSWGSGVSTSGQKALGDATAYAEKLASYSDNSADAIAAAAELNNYLAEVAGSANTVTNGQYVIDGLEAGYYLIKDQDNSLDGSDDSYTSFILRVVKSQTVTPKSGTVESEKKVKDTNDSVANSTTSWQDSADYDIGDEIPFQFTGTVAKNYSSYSKYYYVFHDIESDGLTFNASSVKVYVDGTQITSGYEVVTDTTDGCTFDIVFSDLKKVSAVKANSVITVEYTSTLNDKAVLGSTGNPNEMYLEFSNNPNGEGTGETPTDKVIVFTYKVVVNKVDANGTALAGAQFTLSKKLADGSLKEISVVMAESGTTFTFAGLDDGDYVLKETQTPDGYNTIDDIEFTVTADHDIISDDPRLNSLNGNVVSGTIEFTSSTSEGSLSADVVNKKGSVLPETGGAGRVAIYVIGALLVLGAGVVLVTKRRVNN